jgi:2-keto-4-pentenoate hydratase/2-oxohepta-3-ene-1,7-dioic acid hydratase in catechol pathway
MRLVTYSRNGKGEPRVGIARDESPEAPILDLARSARRLSAGPAARARSVKELLAMGQPALARLARAARSLWAEIGRSARLQRELLAQPDRIRFLPPIPDPEKVICVGQNYLDHCREQNAPVPKSPIIFSKFIPSLIGHGQTVRLPAISEKVDFEAELAFVIGAEGRHIPEERAYRHVAGYMCLNDVSARDLQFSDGQWVRGKSCETFAPCGPALVTRDEVGDPQALRIGLLLNGQTMQDSSTRNLIFNVPYLVSFLSRVFTLKPGDIVSTGTPPGVGCFRKPPVFLKPGDQMTVWIERLGRLTSKVEPERARGRV